MHALRTLTYWPNNVGFFGPSVPQPPNLTSLRMLQCVQSYNSMVFEFRTLFEGGGGVGGQKSLSVTDPIIVAVPIGAK